MTWLFFLAFLGYTAYQKYFTPPPSSIDQPFVMEALLVLSLTLIGPFFISYLFTRATQYSGRVPALMIGFISAVGLSVFGYWLTWKFFGGMGELRMPIEQVLQLGLIPGVIMGVILAYDSLFRRHA